MKKKTNPINLLLLNLSFYRLVRVLWTMNFAVARVAFAYPNVYSGRGGLLGLRHSVGRRAGAGVPFVVGKRSPSLSSSSFRYLTANNNNKNKPTIRTNHRHESHLDSTTLDEPTTSSGTSLVVDKEQNDTVIASASTATANNTTSTSTSNTTTTWYRSIAKSSRKAAGAVASATGFVASAGSTLIGRDRREETLRTIQPSVDAFTKFLTTSGIDLELEPTLNYHLPRNIVILARIQKLLSLKKGSRLDARRQQAADAFEASNNVKKVQLPSRQEAMRYMRYATAAYGSNMIAAAEMDARGKFDTRWSPVTRTRISEHINVPEADIVLMDVDYGNDINHLRHFVAVDHANEKVVLSIRGTFSLSEIVVDVAAFSRPCYGGEAHSEMLTMAERVWQAAGGTVLNMLKENEGYEFIVTGHSLGAGCACLVNIMCQNNRRSLIGGRKMRCFAYASPPVFTALELIPDAVQSTVSYINENDVVPFLSVDSVRHVFSSIRAIEDYMQTKMTRFERIQLSVGYTQPDEALIEAVRQASSNRLEPKVGAPILSIPAIANVWMKEQRPNGEYDFEVCDSQALSQLGLNVDIRMAEDHLPQRYEHAFENLMDEI